MSITKSAFREWEKSVNNMSQQYTAKQEREKRERRERVLSPGEVAKRLVWRDTTQQTEFYLSRVTHRQHRGGLQRTVPVG